MAQVPPLDAVRISRVMQFCSMKRQKDMTLKDELPRSVGANILLEKSGEIAPEEIKRLSKSGNNTQLRLCIIVKVKSDDVKNDIA